MDRKLGLDSVKKRKIVTPNEKGTSQKPVITLPLLCRLVIYRGQFAFFTYENEYFILLIYFVRNNDI